MPWSEWQDGTRRAYEFLEEVEQRSVSGPPLTEEEERMVPIVRELVSKYNREGHRKKQTKEISK